MIDIVAAAQTVHHTPARSLFYWPFYYLGIWTGASKESSWEYGTFSGVAGASFIGAGFGTALWHTTCHEPKCLRRGKYRITTAEGHELRSCKRHHPDPLIRGGRHSLLHIHREHAKSAVS